MPNVESINSKWQRTGRTCRQRTSNTGGRDDGPVKQSKANQIKSTKQMRNQSQTRKVKRYREQKSRWTGARLGVKMNHSQTPRSAKEHTGPARCRRRKAETPHWTPWCKKSREDANKNQKRSPDKGPPRGISKGDVLQNAQTPRLPTGMSNPVSQCPNEIVQQ